MTKLTKLFRSESGATAIEYGLIAALISLALFLGAQLAGNALDNMFTLVGTTLDNAGSSVNTGN